MEVLITQLKRSVDHNLYYLSLFTALAIPDICGAISSSNGEATGDKYCEWYRKHVFPHFDTLTPEECYHYRCTVLHQGRSIPNKSKDYERILFLEPNQSIRLCVTRIKTPTGACIMVDLKGFIEAIISGTERWLRESTDDPNFKANYPKFMHRHPTGLGQWVSGRAVIS